ncbi:hypothetical protein BIX87_01365 [Mycoplasmoides pneumoniae]|nr:hypothetical protein BIX87_01365 [Mycoplasmoides pneumoniae]
MRSPLGPKMAAIGSTTGSLEITATLDLVPGERSIFLISIVPLAISGVLEFSKNSSKRESLLESVIGHIEDCFWISLITKRYFLPISSFSPLLNSRLGM